MLGRLQAPNIFQEFVVKEKNESRGRVKTILYVSSLFVATAILLAFTYRAAPTTVVLNNPSYSQVEAI